MAKQCIGKWKFGELNNHEANLALRMVNDRYIETLEFIGRYAAPR